ncbi:TPA: EpsG family protein [Proteus mirabilis]|uniref:EpsG family protein n=1 Tax=Proteus mirabilis TaxID=584 RepID=UPI0003842F5B|nr:EpsG family protein [Proteus mirabilis]AGS61650.1 hypothetical protein BB2000_3207 [Proteus mirabilis BB2000]EKW7427489.1 EpsG family protein [Proteus mirabilis]ELB1231541.1 EpsG family protein [Proteus mirabilis]MCL8580739.1 EpsG family protein [Proteus mirabilis]MCL8591905.1 EpsG family protein [Proteus mirabilis]
MIPYFFVFFSLIFLSFCEYLNLFKKRIIPICISFTIIALFSGLRGDVGQDTANYLNIFNNINIFKDDIETGFYIFNIFFKNIYSNFDIFLLFCAVFSLFFYFYALYKFLGIGLIIAAFIIIYSDIYLYFNLSGLRQGIALSIIMLSGYYAMKGHIYKFIFSVIFAALFHKTALIAFIFWPLLNFNLERYLNIYSTIFIILISVLWILISKQFIEILAHALNIRGANMYLSESYNKFSIEAYIVGIIRRSYPIVFVFILTKFNFKNDFFIKKLFFIYIFGFILYLINYPLLQDITVRLSSYFIIFESVLVVYILINTKYMVNKIFYVTILFIILSYKLFTYASLPKYQYIINFI